MNEITSEILARCGGLDPEDFNGMTREQIAECLKSFFSQNPSDNLTDEQLALAADEIFDAQPAR